MARKASAISIVQAEPQLISRLQIAPGGGAVEVLAHDLLPGPFSDHDGLRDALKQFTEAHGFAEDELYTVLPRHHITTRIVNLPSHDVDEIASMVRLSAEEWVPYSADEIIVDQVMLQKLPSGEARVLVAIAHQDVVNAHVALLREAGLEPRHIYLSTTCLAAAAHAAGSGAVKGERYALVNLAAGGLEVLVFNHGRLEFGRGLATNHEWPVAEPGLGEAIDELAVEVRGSLATYRRESEDGEAVETVFLCSDGTTVAPYVEALIHETGKEVGTAPFISGLVSAGAEKLKGLPLASLGAAVTAQGRAPYAVDLVPASVTRGREMAGTRQRVLRVVKVAGIVLVALIALYAQALMQRRAYIAELEEQISAIEDSAEDVEEKETQLNILRTQVARNGSLLEMLATVAESAPEQDVNVTRVTFSREEGLDVWGLARDLDLVHQFTSAMRAAATSSLEFFKHARSMYNQEGMENAAKVFHYQIKVPLEEELPEASAT